MYRHTEKSRADAHKELEDLNHKAKILEDQKQDTKYELDNVKDQLQRQEKSAAEDNRTIEQLKGKLGEVEHDRSKSQNELNNLRKQIKVVENQKRVYISTLLTFFLSVSSQYC